MFRLRFNLLLLTTIFFITSCDTPEVIIDTGDNGPTIVSVTANGSEDSATDTLTIRFREDMTGLEAGDIYLRADFPVIKGALNVIDSKNYQLGITPGN